MTHTAIAMLAIALAAAARAKTPPTAADELGAAISTLKAKHINREKVDWKAIEARAWAGLPSNGKPEDAYPAINTVIKVLGEKHTSLFTRDEWKAEMTDRQQGSTRPAALTPPEFRMLPDHVGYVHIYAFIGNDRAVKAYEAHFRGEMAKLRTQGACRYVVDLRGNEGGNMWPMLNGVAPLLGDPPFGFFEPGADPGEVWTVRNGEVQPVDTADINRIPANSSARNYPPVAVLVDRHTSSSGEFTAMAFEGRGGTRFFGQPTAGYVTGNDVFPLPDGAEIALTTSGSQDRLHRHYRERIVPDEITAPGAATDTAGQKWLRSVSCRAVK
jgi:C-terminal processing protease CtpA/Prc